MYYVPETKRDLAECLAEPMHQSRRSLLKFALAILLFLLLLSLAFLLADFGKKLIKAARKSIKEKLG